jgi:GPH family glycoside/pentoside/hexuronide:cation symporter
MPEAKGIVRAAGEQPQWPLSRILTYSSPLLAVHFTSTLFHTYYLKYGADVLLVAPSVIGIIYGSTRLWEAICDPLVGFLSDRTRHRLGRRRSWVLGAAFPLCVFPFMMWSPLRGLEGTQLLIWLGLGAFGLATALSSFQIPHLALGAEMSPESRDRTRFFATNGVMGALGSFAALGLGLRILRTAEAPRTTAIWLFGAVALLIAVLSVWMVARSRELSHHQGRGASSPLRAYLDVWHNPHARMLILVGLFVHATYGAMATVAVFMMQYVMRMPGSTELFMVCYFIPALLAVPIWVTLARRFEKRHLWMVCLAGSVMAYGLMGLVPEQVSLAILLPLAALMGLAGGGFFVFEPSIRAEVIDFDEHETGERKEGVYSAASQLAGKAAGALMTVFVGLALDWAGYVPNADQAEAVKWVIRGLFAGVPALFFLTALLLLSRFKLSEKRHAQIRVELDRRQLEHRGVGSRLSDG